MNFKNDFLTALQAGKDYEALIELVRRYRDLGFSLNAAYEVLQQIWLDYGFNEIEEGSRLQEDLEFVMEKTWYGKI